MQIRLQEVQILEANNREGLALEDFLVMHSLVPFSLIKKLLLLFFIYKPAKGKSYKAYKKHTGNPKYKTKERERTHQPLILKLATPKKPISEVISSPMYMLFQPHKLETKECFNLYTAKDQFLRLNSFFLSKPSKKCTRERTDFQIFDLFFPTKSLSS